MSMAKTIRQVNCLFALNVMGEQESVQSDKTNLEDRFYWLNELAETLDPYLEVE